GQAHRADPRPRVRFRPRFASMQPWAPARPRQRRHCDTGVKKMTIRPIVLALACTLPVGQALADARINYRSEGDGAEIQAMLIGHGKVRSDSDDTSVIFDA